MYRNQKKLIYYYLHIFYVWIYTWYRHIYCRIWWNKQNWSHISSMRKLSHLWAQKVHKMEATASNSGAKQVCPIITSISYSIPYMHAPTSKLFGLVHGKNVEVCLTSTMNKMHEDGHLSRFHHKHPKDIHVYLRQWTISSVC